MSKETRDRIAFRMQPETRRRIEQWYAADNCQSKLVLLLQLLTK